MIKLKDIFRKVHILTLRLRASRCKSVSWSDKRVLIVAPHPDDEVIGCGGLIARLVAEGKMPHAIFMTGGEGSHKGCCSIPKEEIRAARRKLTENALGIFGVGREYVHELDFHDGQISAEDSQMRWLREMIEAIKPEAVFIPHWGEGWPDHVNTAAIVKELLTDSSVEIYEYCVWMWYYNVWRGLDWKNAVTLRMTEREHELKLKAMDAYVKPLAPCGRPWSGALPELFLKANQGANELYFKIK